MLPPRRHLLSTLAAAFFAITLIGFNSYADSPPAKPTPAKATALPALAINEKDILTYLQEAINWRRALVEDDLPPDNARISLIKDALHQNSQKILKNSFDFARLAGTMLEKEQVASHPDTGDNAHPTLIKKISDNKQYIEDIKKQLETITEQMQTAAASERAALAEQKEKLNGALKVASAHQDLLNNFAVVFSGNNTEEAGFTGAVNKLSHSIISDLNEPVAANTVTTRPDSTAAKTQDDGILSISSDIFALSRKKNTLDKLIEQANGLKASNEKLITLMRISLQQSIKEGDAIASSPVEKEVQSSDQRRQKLDNWLASYKKLSSAVIPLGQISALLDSSHAGLKEWQTILKQEWNKVLSHFLLRFAVLCVSIIVPFIFMELSRRAVIRYIKDPIRLRQLNVVRQIIFITFLTLILFLNFFTEFGSLATYAGFLTAGLAVALQTVLVSLTAHFFFFGRFGVRAGDRVTISGVNGDVIQVGILRIYLMELIGHENDLRPSGKIVAFPNSILFNSTAFSKKISEKNYSWNDLSFIFNSDIDFASATKKIMEVVNSVYHGYSKSIEIQHRLLEQSTNLSIRIPCPKSEIIIRDNAIMCEIHYPVLPGNAIQVYGEIVKQLIASFNNDTRLKLIISTPFKIENRVP